MKGDFTMIKDNEQLKKDAETAQFRFALIAPVVQGLFPDASRRAYYKRVSSEPLTLPDGSLRKYDFKTIEKWVSLYNQGGLDALMPHARSDKGSTRALPDTAIEEIFRLKQEFPRLNATQIHKQLISESFIDSSVSVCAVQRFIKKHDLKSARNPSMRDRKAFEEDAFGKLWQADTCYLPHITEDGKTRRVYCMMIIDDHSRMLVGGGLFYNDNAYNFQKVLKSAISRYGIPSKLYVDNGAPYSNEQLSMICVSCGIKLLHTRIRDGASKAKVERHFRTLRETWLYSLNLESITSLEQFNSKLAEYMHEYNHKHHSGINGCPYDRFTCTSSQVRVPLSEQWLNDSFLNRTTRKVRRDSTVSIDSVSYDVPMQFISSTVDIRYLPDDMANAFILFEGEHFPIRKTSLNENCHTKRNNGPAIDYSKIGGAR